MLAQPFSSEYSNTINSLGHQPQHVHTQQQQQPSPTRPPPAPPKPPSNHTLDDLPAHPIIQQYLLNQNSNPNHHPLTLPSATPITATDTTTASATGTTLSGIAPPASSDFFTHPNQDRPYFLYCLSCSTPLSDVFHVTDGDDTHVTVDAVYTDSVLSATQPTVVSQQGLFYALSCQRCGSHIGRYYRFTSPGAINKCNMFSLDVQCVGVRMLGSGTVKGEQYAEETGIATRLTQVMLTTAAVREEMDQVKEQGKRMQQQLDRSRRRVRSMEQRLRRVMGDQYDSGDHDDEEAEAEEEALTTAARSEHVVSARENDVATNASSAATSARSAPSPAKRAALPLTSQAGSAAKKRGRASKSSVSSSGQREKEADDELAFVPPVKRKEKAAAAVAVGREETDVDDTNRPVNGIKRGKQRRVNATPPR